MTDTPTIASFAPVAAPANSFSYTVTVTGTGFLSTYTALCKFGTFNALAATVLSSTALKCLTPSTVSTPTSTSLQLSLNNGVDYTTAGSTFGFYSMCIYHSQIAYLHFGCSCAHGCESEPDLCARMYVILFSYVLVLVCS